MDTKLARGHLREGFRRDLKGVDGVQDALAQVHRPYIERLQSRGKLSKSEAKEALVRVSAFKNDPHHTVFLERFTRGGIKSVSPNFDGAIVGGNFSSGPVTLFGHEEKVRSYSLFYDRYSNKGIEMRLMERPIYVREHARRVAFFLIIGIGVLLINIWKYLIKSFKSRSSLQREPFGS